MDVQTAPIQEATQPQRILERTNSLQIPPPDSVTLPPPSATRIRNSHLNLDTFSPVNQNGSFEFDRVLKSGYVQKRTRKTKVVFTRLDLRKSTDKLRRRGSQSSSSFGRTLSRYTKTKTKIN
jgi:hypothetical protein